MLRSLNQNSFNLLLPKITLNLFWKEVVTSWGDYIGNPQEPSDILNQPLWNNYFIKTENKPIYWKSWIDAEIKYIRDIIDDKGNFLSHAGFC